MVLPYSAVLIANAGRERRDSRRDVRDRRATIGPAPARAPAAPAPVRPARTDAREPLRPRARRRRRADLQRRGCRAEAAWGLLWNNPKLHTPERRKVWLACDEHREHLEQFLDVAAFLQQTSVAGAAELDVRARRSMSPAARAPPALILAAVVLAVLCCSSGRWQWNRHESRDARST